jgi:hypothetical protein
MKLEEKILIFESENKREVISVNVFSEKGEKINQSVYLKNINY